MRTFTLIDKRTGEVTFEGEAVTRYRRCPICDKPDWCLHDRDRGLTICPRTMSNREVGDAGWLHGRDTQHADTVHLHSKPRPQPIIDFRDMANSFYEAGDTHSSNAPSKIEQLATLLGVSDASLQMFHAGWNVMESLWTFPMQDARGNVIGIRVRNDSGEKWCVTGSRNGLFVPSVRDGDGPLFIEEGPTSAAALLDMGLDAIGRPSCSACVQMTVDFVGRRQWVIVANRDEAKKRPDGSVFYPGQDGARVLALALAKAGNPGRIIEPLVGKDSRDWKKSGATRHMVMQLVKNARIITEDGNAEARRVA